MMLLIDTNITSFMLSNAPELGLFGDVLLGRELAISVMTIAEHWTGANLAGWGASRRKALEELLDSFCVLDATREVAYDVAYLEKRIQKVGRPVGRLGSYDTWIAATARVHNLPLATHNTKHFKAFPGLNLIAPAS